MSIPITQIDIIINVVIIKIIVFLIIAAISKSESFTKRKNIVIENSVIISY